MLTRDTLQPSSLGPHSISKGLGLVREGQIAFRRQSVNGDEPPDAYPTPAAEGPTSPGSHGLMYADTPMGTRP